jgi:hypothetical protein
MTARQQVARLLPPALLVVLAIVGLRATVPGPRWDGPLRAYGVAIGVALEVVLGVLFVITVRRDMAAMRALPPEAAADGHDITVPGALRFVLKWVLGLGMLTIAGVLIANLHLHWFIKPTKQHLPLQKISRPRTPPPAGGGGGGAFHFPVGTVLYALLIAALLAAVVLSIWWAARLRRAASPAVPGDFVEDSEGLRDAVESGRAALAGEIDDARAAIIACYLAMERSLADRGTARAAADTPDELLARAVQSGIVRGGAARRLTTLFYEARFSSHPLGADQRQAASRALDDLAAELRAKASAESEVASGVPGGGAGGASGGGL